MFKIYFIIIALFFSLQNSFAQTEPIRKNVLYLELAGSGLLYSFNYDRLLVVDRTLRFSTTLSTWFIPAIESMSDFNYMVGTSLGFNTLLGTKKHFAELGINLAYMSMQDIDDNNFYTFYLPIRMGYRYQKNEGGLFYRVSFMPIIPIIQDQDVQILYPVTPHFALGIGYSF